MATTSAPTSEPWTFDLVGQLRQKFGLGPENWDRFKGQAAEVPGADVPPSGAHVTLKDLSRPAESLPARADEAAVQAALADDGGWVGTPDPSKYAAGTTQLSARELQEEVAKGNVMTWKDFKQQVSGLQGPEREALLALVAQRVAAERMFFTLEDGSKVSLWDLQQYVDNNPELAALAASVRRIAVADPEDPAGRPLPGGGASGLDRSRGLTGAAHMSGQEAEELELDWGQVGRGALWRRRPTRWLLGGLDGVKDWELEAYAHEPLANQLLGAKYGGRDPRAVVADPAYAADVLRAGPLLGMTFVLRAARDLPLQEVASSWRGLLGNYLQRQAPLSLPKAVRPAHLDPTDLNGVAWPALLSRPAAAAHAAAEAEAAGAVPDDEMGVAWRVQSGKEAAASVAAAQQLLQSLPDALCPGPSPAAWPLTGTKLVDEGGRNWRRGGSVWVTLQPEGGVLVQAQTGGVVGEQESYLLTHVQGQEALAGAVMSAFMGPQPLDPELAAAARSVLLVPANGFTAANKERDPNHPLYPSFTGVRPGRAPRDVAAYTLAGGRTPLLAAGGPGEAKLASELRTVMEAALAAAARAEAEALADAATSPSSTSSRAAPAAALAEAEAAEARRARGRAAAAAVMAEGLRRLGPDAVAMLERTAAEAEAPQGGGAVVVAGAGSASGEKGVGLTSSDIFSLARTLEQE
ncbi:hypothetical protein CHLRE_08g378750v5 [Chlamydomonas reinhardtii]|uniref:Uncharacterized protein n=1 Tax=Chlamydomonas reinhardtii TaxID=3055 RepID=A0A2K3DHV6_CHLRE|nr:uncharacterized protein CHLRE_08g378750v5 [Chlamydomonas reinhardtii]PNW80120.1 hypothetical protein CHLRE_08g378750v5 [Chlamydomonas reinhardtii]